MTNPELDALMARLRGRLPGDDDLAQLLAEMNALRLATGSHSIARAAGCSRELLAAVMETCATNFRRGGVESHSLEPCSQCFALIDLVQRYGIERPNPEPEARWAFLYSEMNHDMARESVMRRREVAALMRRIEQEKPHAKG